MQVKSKTLRRLINAHDKRVEKFQNAEMAAFHPYAVKLCRRIKRGIPEFEGCQLAMRRLYLEPSDLKILYTKDGEFLSESLGNLINDVLSWYGAEAHLPQDTINALLSLDELANFIDNNYSNVTELSVAADELK
jgi:hypothetical protein